MYGNGFFIIPKPPLNPELGKILEKYNIYIVPSNKD